ncbi:MAG: hypothetical protein ACLUEK_02920 [Oscillospiraceae bacterium]
MGEPPHPITTRRTGCSAPRGKDAELMADAVERAAQAAVCYVTEGPERAMSK